LGPFEETAAGEGVTLFGQGINPNLAVFHKLYHFFGSSAFFLPKI
jgi:hypothetical protein